MPAGSGNLQGALGCFLSFYLREIQIARVIYADAAESLSAFGTHSYCAGWVGEKVADLLEMTDRIDVETLHQAGLVGIDLRQDDVGPRRCQASHGDRQDAGDRAHGAIEPELADQPERLQSAARQVAAGSQYANSNWQVVGRTFLTRVGRGHVDNPLFARRQQVRACLDCRA